MDERFRICVDAALADADYELISITTSHHTHLSHPHPHMLQTRCARRPELVGCKLASCFNLTAYS